MNNCTQYTFEQLQQMQGKLWDLLMTWDDRLFFAEMNNKKSCQIKLFIYYIFRKRNNIVINSYPPMLSTANEEQIFRNHGYKSSPYSFSNITVNFFLKLCNSVNSTGELYRNYGKCLINSKNAYFRKLHEYVRKCIIWKILKQSKQKKKHP